MCHPRSASNPHLRAAPRAHPAGTRTSAARGWASRSRWRTASRPASTCCSCRRALSHAGLTRSVRERRHVAEVLGSVGPFTACCIQATACMPCALDWTQLGTSHSQAGGRESACLQLVLPVLCAALTGCGSHFLVGCPAAVRHGLRHRPDSARRGRAARHRQALQCRRELGWGWARGFGVGKERAGAIGRVVEVQAERRLLVAVCMGRRSHGCTPY